jgi:DNA replication factor GINS
MYSELYDIWMRELENPDLTKLRSSFYNEISDYVRKLRDEGRMLDKRTVKASLLKKEMLNVKRMTQELIHSRCLKLINKVANGEKVESGVLTVEEEKICGEVSLLHDNFRSLAASILRGHGPRISEKRERRRAVLRFLKDVPAIVGLDMKTYGPFKIEDVASLPAENAKIFVKQGFAEEIEID